MAPRVVRTGQEELDWLRQQRERSRATFKILRSIEQMGGLKATFGEDKPPSGALLDAGEKPSQVGTISEYYDRYKRGIHERMGGLIGSTMDPRGQISKTISPGIKRDPATGARVKPQAPTVMGPEYEWETKYQQPPKWKAYAETLKYTHGGAGLSAAKSAGSELAMMRREQSRVLAHAIETTARRVAGISDVSQSGYPEWKANFIKELQTKAPWSPAGGAESGKQVIKGLGNMGLVKSDLLRIGGVPMEAKPISTVNTPVNPSVKTTPQRRGLPKSPLEPRTQVGAEGIPEVFKKAWGTPPTALGGLGIGGAVHFSGPDRAESYSSLPNESDVSLFHRTVGTSRATFQARTLIDYMRRPENTPEQRYEMWRRFGPRRTGGMGIK